MRFRVAWLSFAFAMAFASSGRTAEPRALSIEDAIALAEERSEAVAAAKAGMSRADAQQVQAFSEWLPQVNGSLSYDRTLLSEFDGVFDAPVQQPGAPPSPFADLPFGRDNTWRAGVTASQNLYAGGRTAARQRLAEAAQDNALLALETARAQAVLDTVQAYYDAVLSEQLLRIAESTVRQAELTLQQTELGHRDGTRPEFDLLRAQVALENQRPGLLQRSIDRDAARLRLKQVLDIPFDEDVRLVTSLETSLATGPADLTEVVRTAAPADADPFAVDEDGAPLRLSVRQAQQTLASREASVDLAWAQHLPQLNLTTSFGYVTYPDKLAFAPDELRNNWTVGVAVTVPLFSGFRITGEVDAARADVLEAEARRRQAAELARLDSRTTQQRVQAAQATFAATGGVVEQARKASAIAELRYREGVSTQLELADAQLLFDNAQVNRARAARDLQVARVRLALLPSLPVGLTP